MRSSQDIGIRKEIPTYVKKEIVNFFNIKIKPGMESLANALAKQPDPVPYFNQAAEIVLYKKENRKTYPFTMSTLRNEDDRLIASNAYDGLSEKQKAQLLSEAALDVIL